MLSKEIKIVSSKFRDVYTLFRLRNNEKIRKISKNEKKINFLLHIFWFIKFKYIDKNYIFILALLDNRIGYCRFEREKFAKNTYFVSIIIEGKYQNSGLGKVLLNSSVKKLADIEQIKHLTVLAEILNFNAKSHIFFLKNGYSKLCHKLDFVIYKKDYIVE